MCPADPSPPAQHHVDLTALAAENRELSDRLQSAERYTAQTLARATGKNRTTVAGGEIVPKPDDERFEALRTAAKLHDMTLDRPYGSGMTSEQALQELQRHGGTQFEADVVAALVEQARTARLTA